VALAGKRRVVDAAIMKAKINSMMKWAVVATLIALPVALPLRPAHAAQPQRDGSRDFDWEVGLWNTHLKVLRQNPDGTTTWVTYEGTSNVISIWNCRADMVQLEADGPGGRHVSAINLRMYDKATHQWNLNFANIEAAEFGVPTIGEFHNGVGMFYDQEPLGGRVVFVRGVWSGITATSAHFVQSISDDGGKTWKANWIADDTRMKGTTNECAKGMK
jgi:hypothetical protein